MKVSELRRRLEKAGCYVKRHGANHDIYFSPKTGESFPVSRHTSEELPISTQRNIEKAAGI